MLTHPAGRRRADIRPNGQTIWPGAGRSTAALAAPLQVDGTDGADERYLDDLEQVDPPQGLISIAAPTPVRLRSAGGILGPAFQTDPGGSVTGAQPEAAASGAAGEDDPLRLVYRRRPMPTRPEPDSRRVKQQRLMGLLGAGAAVAGAFMDSPALLVAGNAVAGSAKDASDRDYAEHIRQLNAFYDEFRRTQDWNAQLDVREDQAVYDQQLAEKTRQQNQEDTIAAEERALARQLKMFGIENAAQLERLLMQRGWNVEDREDGQGHALEMQKRGFQHSAAMQQQSAENARQLELISQSLKGQGETFGGSPELLDRYIENLNGMLTSGIEEAGVTVPGVTRRRQLTPKEMQDAMEALQKAYRLKQGSRRPTGSTGSPGGTSTGGGNLFDTLDF